MSRDELTLDDLVGLFRELRDAANDAATAIDEVADGSRLVVDTAFLEEVRSCTRKLRAVATANRSDLARARCHRKVQP